MELGRFMKKIEQQRKEQDAIYHRAAVNYGLSDTAMWILYEVSGAEDGCTQQELCRDCFFPKQTVNTAVKHLLKDGLLAFRTVQEGGNKKKMDLTDKGRALARVTTDRLRRAEFRAYRALTEQELGSYLEIMTKLTVFLQKEIEAEQEGRHGEEHV